MDNFNRLQEETRFQDFVGQIASLNILSDDQRKLLRAAQEKPFTGLFDLWHDQQNSGQCENCGETFTYEGASEPCDCPACEDYHEMRESERIEEEEEFPGFICVRCGGYAAEWHENATLCVFCKNARQEQREGASC